MMNMADLCAANPTYVMPNSYVRPDRETTASPNLYPVDPKTETTLGDMKEFIDQWLLSWEFKQRSRGGYNTTPGSTVEFLGMDEWDRLSYMTQMASYADYQFKRTGNTNYDDMRKLYVDRQFLGVHTTSGDPWLQEFDSPVDGASRVCYGWFRGLPGDTSSGDGSPKAQYAQPMAYISTYTTAWLHARLKEIDTRFDDVFLSKVGHMIADMGADIDISTTTTTNWETGSCCLGYCTTRTSRSGVVMLPAPSDACPSPTGDGSQTFERRHRNNMWRLSYAIMWGWENGVNDRMERLINAYVGYYGSTWEKNIGLVFPRLYHAMRQ